MIKSRDLFFDTQCINAADERVHMRRQ